MRLAPVLYGQALPVTRDQGGVILVLEDNQDLRNLTRPIVQLGIQGV